MSIFSKASLLHLLTEYIDSVFSEGCYCMIDKPTRITPHSSTLLDHVYSNILNKTLTSNILQYEILIIYPPHAQYF